MRRSVGAAAAVFGIFVLACESGREVPTETAAEQQGGVQTSENTAEATAGISGRVLGLGNGRTTRGIVVLENATVHVIRLGDIPADGAYRPAAYQSGPDAVPECATRGTRVASATTDARGEFSVSDLARGVVALRALPPTGSTFTEPAASCFFPVIPDSIYQGVELTTREPGAPAPGTPGDST